MILISHRGNIEGADTWLENTPNYIDNAIALGYQVEVDVWGEDGVLWLGHDRPMYKITPEWLDQRGDVLWLHCKNVHALSILMQDFPWIRYFLHNKDPYAMVNLGYIWCYPSAPPPVSKGIIVLPETWLSKEETSSYVSSHHAEGICSDYIARYQNI
jgi:hypothetical protein